MNTNIAKNPKIRFKHYDQNVCLNLPVYVKDLISENALAQIIDELVEQVRLSSLERYYSQHGCPAFHPRMMLKVWLYGYCTGVYTTRPLAQKLREDLVFIWLSGGQRPCFKTLGSFRSCRMGDLMDDVLTHTLHYLVEQGYVDLGDLYVDGSKWEANANKYKIIWRKNTQRYKEGVLGRISEFLSQVKELQAQEDTQYGRQDLSIHQSSEQIAVELKSDELEQHLVHLNELIEVQSDKNRKRSYEKLGRHLRKEQVKLAKYEAQEVILAGRNSYSKSDEDATALRMKDDQLKPGYNVQITTSNQFILNATIHQNASDSPTLKSHLGPLQERVSSLIEAQLVEPNWQDAYTADAGYGSEENYEFFEEMGFTAYVKYPAWYQQHKGLIAKKPFHSENWFYHEEKDYYICPNQTQLHLKEEAIRKTATGYLRQIRIYEAKGCPSCPFCDLCRSPRAKADSNRKIYRSEKLIQFTQKAAQRLASEKGIEKRKQRGVDVETPFANIKFNMKHRRFFLRGRKKVEIEFQFLALAHNIKKIFCLQTLCWQKYYEQRAAKKTKKTT